MGDSEGGSGGVKQAGATPIVRAEPVEALHLVDGPEEMNGFDKLSPNGLRLVWSFCR